MPRQIRVIRIEARNSSPITVASMHSDLDQQVDPMPPAAQPGRGGLVLRGSRDGARPHGCAHAHTFSRGRSSSREIASTMNEITNRMKPSASSDDSLRLPAGLSGNSSATIEAMVLPGPNSEVRDAVGVADDEGHRHRLAQRAAKPEHDAADHRDPRVGDHDRAHHLPGGAADAVGRFLVDRRHGLEHVAHGRGDERDDHHREDQRGGQDAGAERRACEQVLEHRDAVERIDDRRAGCIRAMTRRDDEEAPHAVDDRRHRGEQFHRGADRPAQPGRREFGQVERDAERERHREEQRQDRGDDRAVDRHRRAEHLLAPDPSRRRPGTPGRTAGTPRSRRGTARR